MDKWKEIKLHDPYSHSWDLLNLLHKGHFHAILDVSLFGYFCSALIHVSLPAPKAISFAPRLSSWIVAPVWAVFFVPHTKRGRRSRDFEHRWHGTNTRWHFYSETPTKILLGMNAKREPRLILYTIFAFATCLHNLSDLLVYVSVKLYIVSIVYHTYLRILYCMNVYLLTTQWHQPACHTSFWLDELVNESLQLLWSLKTS